MTAHTYLRFQCDFCGEESPYITAIQPSVDIFIAESGWVRLPIRQNDPGIARIILPSEVVPVHHFCCPAHYEAWEQNDKQPLAAVAGNAPMLGSNNGRGSK